LEGFTLWAASTFLGLPHWEIWVPLAVGMVAGLLSIVAVRSFGGRGRAPVPAPNPPTKTVAMPPPDPFVHGGALEQRRALRRAGNPVPVLLASPHEDQPSWHAWVIDRSVGGIGLVVNSEFPEGARLKVMPQSAPESTPWIDIEVRCCRPGEEGFELGCQFVKTPPWSLLLLFG